MGKINFTHQTQDNDRLYILWNDSNNECPTDLELQEYANNLEGFDEFEQMESDNAVASHFGYDNCVIFGK